MKADDILQLAQVYVTLNQVDGAINTLQLMLQRYPQDPRGYYGLAIIRAAQNNVPETLTLLEKTFKLSPELRTQTLNDSRFANLRGNPQFQQLVNPK